MTIAAKSPSRTKSAGKLSPPATPTHGQLSNKLSKRGEPTWELALRYPPQGAWTEAAYLELDRHGVAVELVDGCLELLPKPLLRHQRILLLLRDLLVAYFRERKTGAEVCVSPCPMALWPLHMRELDVFVLMPGPLSDPDKPRKGWIWRWKLSATASRTAAGISSTSAAIMPKPA